MRTSFYSIISLLFYSNVLFAACDKHTIAFHNVSMEELVRFASKMSGTPFFYTPEELQFEVNFHSSQEMSTSQLLDGVVELLHKNNLSVTEKNGYLYVEKTRRSFFGKEESSRSKLDIEKFGTTTSSFYIQKLQYMRGEEILSSIKNLVIGGRGISKELMNAIESLQWVESTNSLLYSASGEAHQELTSLIDRLDTKLRQVFIEVLVIETSVKNGSQFGLQWGAKGRINDSLSFGSSNMQRTSTSFAKAFSESAQEGGLAALPTGRGFDFGVIGDIILHKGKTFFTLGSLLDALELDSESTIVLSQKIIAQDSKESRVFVGDNIPFPGSRIETIGASQQTTSNIEYRDVGVSLKITPYIGQDSNITLSISEEISEATPTHVTTITPVNGIQTTKTNMLTRVHVPDSCFLVLSGMIRNNTIRHKTGVPCLGGIPFAGALTSHTKREDEKRNVIIFVRPHIVDTTETYKEITAEQTELFLKESPNKEIFLKSMELAK